MVLGPSHFLGAVNGVAKPVALEYRIGPPAMSQRRGLAGSRSAQAKDGLRGDGGTCIEGGQTSVFANIGHGCASADFDHGEPTRDPGSLGESAVVDWIERPSLPSSFNIGSVEVIDDVDAGRPRQRLAKSHPARRLARKADEGDGVPRQRKALEEMLDRISAERHQVLLDPSRTTGGNRLTEALPLLGGQGKGQAVPALQPARAVGRHERDVDAFQPLRRSSARSPSSRSASLSPSRAILA